MEHLNGFIVDGYLNKPVHIKIVMYSSAFGWCHMFNGGNENMFILFAKLGKNLEIC